MGGAGDGREGGYGAVRADGTGGAVGALVQASVGTPWTQEA